MKKFKDLREEDKLRKEREEFERDIELQLLSSNFNTNSKSYSPYQNAGKKLLNSVLISLLILSIAVFAGWMYTKNHFSSFSEDNINMIHVALKHSIDEYYQDKKRYPADIHGNIDYNTLKREGYLNLNIEEYKSIFRFNNQYDVIRIE